MEAWTIRCPEHRGVVPPDTHRKAVVTDSVGREHLTDQAAVGLAHPLVRRVHIATKIDHTNGYLAMFEDRSVFTYSGLFHLEGTVAA